MRLLRVWILSGLALLGAGGLLLAAAPPGKGKAAPTNRYRDADKVAASVDRHMARGWAAGKVVPARRAGDGEFVRRVYLDLAGRIPSVTEVRTFLKDRRSDKRQRLVEKLLDGPRYVTHFVAVWRALMLPEANSSFNVRFQVPAFENWLRDQIKREVPYDKMVRALLTTPVANNRGGGFFFGNGGASPAPFFSAKEWKPEELASATARLFLGVNVGCAQCHNHPFADWKKEQFWSFATFFSGIKSRRQGDFSFATGETMDAREMTIPGTEKVVQARYLDGKRPKWKAKVSARTTLAEWMTAADNPYFARAAVNRAWAFLMGTGLIEPVDEMIGTENSVAFPKVLDEVAKEFVAHKFDIKWLLRTLTATRAYHLTSARSHASQDDPRQFAKAALRGLTPEQLYDSVAEATGYQEAANRNQFFNPFGPNSPRGEFLTKFSNASDKPTEVQTSILQALTLMNGRLVRSATNLSSSETLAAICDAPFLNTAGRIEVLYLATLSRPPSQKALARLVKYVDSGGSARGKSASIDKEKRYNDALADVFWALLNSGEFFLNH
jgi:hypothetical protein